MSETKNLTLNYTPLESGNGESFWIRLEQERPDDASLSVAEAAEFIDRLYDIEPCDDGMGGGGKGASGENEPEEAAFDEAAAELMRRAGMCDDPEWWEAVVRVYRSHRDPGYELRSETAEVDVTEPVRASYRETVEASGAVIELSMPYDGGLTGIPAGVNWSARGSTINLDRPVNGRLVLRYDTYFERVTLRVPAEPDPNGGQATLPGAAVAAFWRDMAATCDLEPPEQDELGEEEREKICGEPGGGGGSISGTGCWKTVTHYNRCSCSKRRVDEWTEAVPADCGRAVGGTNVGKEEQFGNYVHCDGEEDELSTVEYYMKRCCKPPSGGALPRCRKSWALYRGGEKIENGPEHWQNIYGANVSMIAVSPPGGICGEEITEYDVPRRNCCDEVDPMTPRPGNPSTIPFRGNVELCVDGGNAEKTWRTSGGLYMGSHETVVTAGGDCMVIAADDDACDNGVVRVDDGCSAVSMPLSLEGPPGPMYLEPEHTVVAPTGGYVSVGAVNARGRVQWSASGGLRLVTQQGNQSALFEAPDNFCGLATITATDACANIAFATAQGTAGRWVEQQGFDPCSAPWSGKPRALVWDQEWGHLVEQDGWRGYVRTVQSGRNFGYGEGACPHRGSCQGAIDSYPGYKPPCAYSGRELALNQYGMSLWDGCTPSSVTTCYPLCRNNYECIHYNDGTDWETQDIWEAQVQYITRLWKWECDDGD